MFTIPTAFVGAHIRPCLLDAIEGRVETELHLVFPIFHGRLGDRHHAAHLRHVVYQDFHGTKFALYGRKGFLNVAVIPPVHLYCHGLSAQRLYLI